MHNGSGSNLFSISTNLKNGSFTSLPSFCGYNGVWAAVSPLVEGYLTLHAQSNLPCQFHNPQQNRIVSHLTRGPQTHSLQTANIQASYFVLCE